MKTVTNPFYRNDLFFVNSKGKFSKLLSDVNIATVNWPVRQSENYFHCHPMNGKFYNGDVLS